MAFRVQKCVIVLRSKHDTKSGTGSNINGQKLLDWFACNQCFTSRVLLTCREVVTIWV